jgi:pre-mRNA-processing factor 6
MRQHQVLLTREQWLKEAEGCESKGSPRMCEAIIKATVAMEVEEEGRWDTWVREAESAEATGIPKTISIAVRSKVRAHQFDRDCPH